MATTITTTKKRPEDDELTSSFFEQSLATPDPMAADPATRTTKPQIPGPRRVAAPQVTTNAAAPPGGTLNFSTLVGGGTAPAPQRNTAPPLADQGAPNYTPITAPTPGQLGTKWAIDFWQGLANNAQYSDAQRRMAAEKAREEEAYTGWEREGLTLRGGIDAFNQLAGGQPATPGGPPAAAAPPPSPRPAWMESQSYTPGEINTNDLNYSWEDLLRRMGPDYEPTPVSGAGYQSRDVDAEDFDTYDFGGWSGLPGMDIGALEGLTDDAIAQILANPESLDERTIARLKAAGREEQAAMSKMADDELIGLGFDLGIDDSNFLASERLQNRRDRDAAISAGNRNVEIEAAKTNAGDRRAAATLASAYVDSKGRMQLAKRAQAFGEQAEGEKNKQASVASKQARAEYLTGVKSDNANRALEAAKLRTQADVAHNQNLFNAAKLRQDKVLGTVDADLRRAAATTDRLSLREQSAQAAAELGISRDKLLSDWLQALMDDATQRYGIDIAATVDREKLAQAGSEFKEDLAFRIMALDREYDFKNRQLGESGRQFDYGLGLSYSNLFEGARQHDDNMYARSQGF